MSFYILYRGCETKRMCSREECKRDWFPKKNLTSLDKNFVALLRCYKITRSRFSRGAPKAAGAWFSSLSGLEQFDKQICGTFCPLTAVENDFCSHPKRWVMVVNSSKLFCPSLSSWSLAESSLYSGYPSIISSHKLQTWSIAHSEKRESLIWKSKTSHPISGHT